MLKDDDKAALRGRLGDAARQVGVLQLCVFFRLQTDAAPCKLYLWQQFDALAKTADAVHRRNAHKVNSPFNINIMPTLSDA